ncbi:MAG: DNA repair protein RecO, partial [Mogibacterium sp.]|nr:DNA repair protein RecO [Mogibacterium sp.]
KSALALRPFTYAEYDIFKTRESYSINSAQALKSFYSIGEDLDRFETASAFLEYMNDILEEGEARPKLFDLAVEFLESLSKAESNHKTLLYAFIIKTLFVQGVMPELKVCANCAKSYDRFEKKTPNDTYFFSVKAG